MRLLVIDVERVKGYFHWTDRYDGLDIKGRFWDLSDYKRKFGRIPYTAVTAWPRTICAAYRFYGEKRIRFDAEWLEGGREGFVTRIRDIIDSADKLTGHNAKRADLPWLYTEMRDHGLRLPVLRKRDVIDTLTIARANLGDESMTLGALTQRYGIPTKEGHYDADVADRAVAGSRKDQREIRMYNIADVEASTGLYFATLPLATGHPHVRPNTPMACPRCGSTDRERRGTTSPAVLIYPRYLCRNCDSWWRDEKHVARGSSARAL